MNLSPTRREFIQLSALGFGTAVFSLGLSGCDDHLSEGVDFLHGIASGDPLEDRVILWTRVTPKAGNPAQNVRIGWEVALDPKFARVINSGTTETSALRDYTIKIDAAGLRPQTRYYYRFKSKDQCSPIGLTRTLAGPDIQEVKLAVVSCSNFPAGRFHVYREVARLTDIEAVLHLGDYIYEYARGGYASDEAAALGREVLPPNEILTLSDYRQRYAQYRSDKDLQLAHQNHPFICIWDDHEVANDSWKDGAENHQPDEGSFEVRKLQALQAYSEWIPIRPKTPEEPIFRSFRFGSLVDLHMLDTRLIGRDQPLDYRNYFTANGFDAARCQRDLNDPNRSMLGAEQRAWIYNQLNTSEATWQVLGQQVLIGRMYLPGALSTQQISLAGFARLVKLATMAAQGVPLGADDQAFLAANQKLLALPPLPYNADAWDAYEIERQNLLQTAKSAGSNLVVLAGDSHNAWANELLSAGEPCGVEFATASVTSPGLEAILGISAADAVATEAQVMSLIPNLKYSNLRERGFLVMTFREEEASGEFIFVDDILAESYTILGQRGRTLRVKAGDNRFAVN